MSDGRGKYIRKPKIYSIEGLPIDDAATKEKFGYAATEVSPSSLKKVCCYCTQCKRPFERQRGRITATTICRSCAHTKEEGATPFPYKSGYEKIELTCVTCGKAFKRRRMSANEESQCRPCIKRAYWKKHSADVYSIEGLPIDGAMTQELFGYAATSIRSRSLKFVSCRCTQCNQVFNRARVNVTATALCDSCAHTKDRKPALFPYQTGYVKVALVCVTCGKSFEQSRKTARENVQCRSCFQRQRGFYKLGKGVAHPYLLDAVTQERFGYAATAVRTSSYNKVVVQCVRCGNAFERARRFVKEEPVCSPCCRKVKSSNPAKCKETMLQRYGRVGVPLSERVLGQAEKAFGERLEVLIGRTLVGQRVIPSGQRVDFYDEVSSVGVEYNGLHWHHELSFTPRNREYHQEKQLVSATVGIDLITVFEDEWRDRQYQVENVIMARMGVYARKVGARQCTVRQITVPEANTLLEREHIQGGAKLSRWAWGLELEKEDGVELLGVLTLAPHHRGGHKDSIVLNRLCFARGVQVVGGASRLLTVALSSLQGKEFKKLLSWSDNRWSKGTVYAKLGFTCVEELPPDYTYVVVTKPRERLSKQSQMKSRTGCPVGMTEIEWAHQSGLARVWDCGKKRWEICLKD
jgi:hypothetical protein